VTAEDPVEALAELGSARSRECGVVAGVGEAHAGFGCGVSFSDTESAVGHLERADSHGLPCRAGRHRLRTLSRTVTECRWFVPNAGTAWARAVLLELRVGGWGALAFLPTMALSGLLLLPGMVTGSPWLEMIGPTLALLLVVAVTTSVLPTLLGVVFVERSGLIRCLHLVKRRFWLALARTLVIGLTYAAYTFVTTALVRLVLWPFGGPQAVSHPGLAAVHLLDAALAVPLVVYVIAATVVTYAELRFREDDSTTTGLLAAEIRV
jgi:hypothetical protein